MPGHDPVRPRSDGRGFKRAARKVRHAFEQVRGNDGALFSAGEQCDRRRVWLAQSYAYRPRIRGRDRRDVIVFAVRRNEIASVDQRAPRENDVARVERNAVLPANVTSQAVGERQTVGRDSTVRAAGNREREVGDDGAVPIESNESVEGEREDVVAGHGVGQERIQPVGFLQHADDE